jgi:hypothetical protein
MSAAYEVKLTPEQTKAVESLKMSLREMDNVGFGTDGIRRVLDETFSGICVELGGNPLDGRTWRKKTDPYIYSGPVGRGRAAEATIIPPKKP